MAVGRSRGVAFAALCASVLAIGVAAGPAAADKPRAGKAVIGGSPASLSDWPWQAAVVRKGRLHCGASVIAPTKILTAAHCVFRFKPASLRVITGRSRLRAATGGEEIPVASASIHPDYPTTFRHDIAVITLAFPTSAPSIGLPTAEQDRLATAPGSLLRVAGFGARNPLGGKLSGRLLQTTERVRTNRRCKKAFRSGFSGRAMICALGKRLRRFKLHTTACSGDSGGPLVADTSSGPVAVGTVSYGGPVCGYRAPTVYARVSDALDFVLAAL
jgi:secreted trypsin-like serine protease